MGDMRLRMWITENYFQCLWKQKSSLVATKLKLRIATKAFFLPYINAHNAIPSHLLQFRKITRHTVDKSVDKIPKTILFLKIIWFFIRKSLDFLQRLCYDNITPAGRAMREHPVRMEFFFFRLNFSGLEVHFNG